MRKLFIFLTFALCACAFSFGQRFAYVDTDYILEQMDDYKHAQSKLDEIASNWREDIDMKYEKVEEMYRAYQAEEPLLTEEMKRKRQDDIMDAEKVAKEFQKQKFGYEGALFKKRQELVKPIQDKVYNAIKKIAQKKSYSFIFDKSAGVSILYSDPKYDLSNEVLKELGISAGNWTE